MTEPAYRDASQPIAVRVEDLLNRMTLDEKAALMLQPAIVVGEDGGLSEGEPGLGVAPTEEVIGDRGITHVNLVGSADDARTLARWHNALQRRAAATRLGIPVTVSTDPRHHFTDNPATAALAGAFSLWPEIIGLAALHSPERVQEFADIVRREYTAVGLRVALHPQLDLATEPRWARINNTFGEDAELASRLGVAYVVGLQGATLGPESVAAMLKHFPGGGPQKDGEDPHFPYGREQVYPGDNFAYHLEPFRAALAANASQVMPYYGMPIGTPYAERGFAFDPTIVTGLLRGELGFDGIVCTDWGIITDSVMMGEHVRARAWGVEHLDALSRAELVITAGCDQFGGEDDPHLISDLVQSGRVSEERIDESVRRLLTEKFALGLFDRPFVDEDRAAAVVGATEFRDRGLRAQRDSYTLLTSRDDILPLSRSVRIYVDGIDPEVAAEYAEVVASPSDADVALLRVKAPFERREGFFESIFHTGSLAFPQAERHRHAELTSALPTIVDIALDRPAVIPELARDAAALLASYGSEDRAFLDVVFGIARPLGRLPFDMASSMAAVIDSREDVPFDTAEPLFRFGHGLQYTRAGDAGSPRRDARAASEPDRSVAAPADAPTDESPVRYETAGPEDFAGTWDLTVATPRGLQGIRLVLSNESGMIVGDLAGAALRDTRIRDGELSFRTSLTEPFPVRIRVTARLTDQGMTGSAKAAMFPLALSFEGRRAGRGVR